MRVRGGDMRERQRERQREREEEEKNRDTCMHVCELFWFLKSMCCMESGSEMKSSRILP